MLLHVTGLRVDGVCVVGSAKDGVCVVGTDVIGLAQHKNLIEMCVCYQKTK